MIVDTLEDVSIDSFSSSIEFCPVDEVDRTNIAMFNDSIGSWLGRPYIMQPVLANNPTTRLIWDRWATPIYNFVERHFHHESVNPGGLYFPYCGVVAFFIDRCTHNNDGIEYLACLLQVVLNDRSPYHIPMARLAHDIFCYMHGYKMLGLQIFKTMAWALRANYQFVMWERQEFMVHTTLPSFDQLNFYPREEPSIFSDLLRRRARRMQAPPSNGPFTPAPIARTRRESVAVTRGRREVRLPERFKV